jgi:hypothetical protein
MFTSFLKSVPPYLKVLVAILNGIPFFHYFQIFITDKWKHSSFCIFILHMECLLNFASPLVEYKYSVSHRKRNASEISLLTLTIDFGFS